MNRPIKPSEVQEQKDFNLPGEVFQVFNLLITQKWNEEVRSATVMQAEAVSRIAELMKCSRQHVYDNGWADVEHAYRKAGWTVVYDKPGYNESYGAFFIFKK